MAEKFATNTEGKAMSGSTRPFGTPIPTTDEDEWDGPLNSSLDAGDRNQAASVSGQVFPEEGLTTFGVRAGAFRDERTKTLVTIAAVTAQALTASETNYIFTLPDGTLTVNIIGWPSVPHYPQATIVTGVGAAYEISDVTDFRGRGMHSLLDTSPPSYSWSEDFAQAAGTTLPEPWKADRQSGNETRDYVNAVAAGVYQLGLTNANEAQAVQLTHGDLLTVDADQTPIVDFYLSVAGIADLTSVELIYFGLMPAHAAAETAMDGIAHSIWFKLVGGADLTIYMEADDGATNTDDVDTGIELVDDTLTHFRLDLTDLTAVKMFVDGVEAASTLTLTASTGQLLQPVVVVQRADATQTEVGFEVNIDLSAAVAVR